MKKVFNSIYCWLYYVIYDTIREKLINLKYFFKNLRIFWKVLKEFRTWDYAYIPPVIVTMLTALRDDIKNGPEIELTSFKKASQIDKLIKLIKSADCYDSFDILFDKDTNKQRRDIKQYDEINYKIQKRFYRNVERILLGQSPEEYNKEIEKINKKGIVPQDGLTVDDYAFDGTGIQSWWS